MSLFDKLKGKTSPAEQDNDQPAAPQSIKDRSALAKVLDESVWESVYEDLKANKRFIRRDKNGKILGYIALVFDTNQVGGLAGKDAKKDESKGSIIEAIKTSRIKTYLRTDMMCDNAIVIVPDKETISNMDEYNLLVRAKYSVGMLDSNGNIDILENANGEEFTVTYNDVKNYIGNEYAELEVLLPGYDNSADVFGGGDIDYDSYVDSEETVKADPDDDLYADLDGDGDIAPDIDIDGMDDAPDIEVADMDPEPIDDDFDPSDIDMAPAAADPVSVSASASKSAPAPKPIPTPASAPASTPVTAAEPEEYYEVPSSKPAAIIDDRNAYSDGSYVDVSGGDMDIDNTDYYEEEDPFANYTEDAVRDFVARTFYSEDLGIEVSTQPFDIQFLHGNIYKPFDTHRGEGHLDKALSNISRDGNLRMERLHSENIFKLRTRYLSLMQGHCANIQRQLDTSDPSTKFGEIKASIDRDRHLRLEKLKDEAKVKIDTIQKTWEATLESVGREAHDRAIEEYRRNNGEDHERELARAETDIKDEIDRDYHSTLARMNENRRKEAQKLLDYAINATLEKLSDDYSKVLQAEKVEYIRIQNELSKFIDDNRKSEIQRIAVLAEENSQRNRAEEVRKEYAAKIKAITAEFDANMTRMRDEVNAMRVSHANDLSAHKKDSDNKLREERSRTQAVQAQLDDLIDKYATLETEKNGEYKDRIKRLQDESRAYQDELDHVVEVHKRSSRVAVYLVIAAIIAFMGIGFMVGSIVSIRRTSDIEQETINKVAQDDAVNKDSTQSVAIEDDKAVTINGEDIVVE